MSDAKRIKSWRSTETLLERATGSASAPAQHEQEAAALLAQYREFMEHDELGLALDILEDLGHLISARGGFCRDLERAAENMGLVDKLPALRKSLFSRTRVTEVPFLTRERAEKDHQCTSPMVP